MQGAISAEDRFDDSILEYNECYKYAVLRNLLYESDKSLEMLVTYTPRLHYFTEWWKQLFGESEGKDGKGLFPVGVEYTTDLHSLGQMIQDGKRHFFETVINVVKPEIDLEIPFDEDNLDGLNFLKGHTMDYVNKQAMEGTAIAHKDGGTPNMRINIDSIDEETFGQMIYFFEFACALSAYTLKVNPFNQPGVESYKKNMFALLGKPGYEAMTEELLKKLNK
jgi:glucose-6-phosphate isomerase